MNFPVFSMEFAIKNCLPFAFQTDGNFYQIILSHTRDSPYKDIEHCINFADNKNYLVGTVPYLQTL